MEEKAILQNLGKLLQPQSVNPRGVLHVKFHNNSTTTLEISFKYNPEIVALVKSVPDRRYDPKKKIWLIPLSSLRDLEKKAARENFHIVLDPLVQEVQYRSDRIKTELASLKYSGEFDLRPIVKLRTKSELRTYQKQGIAFLYKALGAFRGALLADDMGTGKTLAALCIADLVLQAKPTAKILVLCPSSLKYVWQSEIEKHFGDTMSNVVIDGPKNKRSAIWAQDVSVYICNYELLLYDTEPFSFQWDLVIADEATYLKNRNAQRTKRAKQLRRNYTLALSGIPIENSLEELYSIMDFTNKGVLGSYWAFIERFCVRDPWGGIVGYRNIKELKEQIDHLYIRRTKKDVLKELPPKVYNNQILYLTSDERELYDAIRLKIIDEIENEDNDKLKISNILTKLLRLKQVLLDPGLVDLEFDGYTTKTKALLEIIETSFDHKIVVFTQFAQYANRLKEIIPNALLLEGSMAPTKRQEVIEEFQRNPARKIFISTDAGAYGVTLTAADIMIHMDLPWTPAKMRQREDRLHRIGQSNSVNITILTAEQTIDRYVQNVLHKKYGIIKSVLGEEDDLEQFVNVIPKEEIIQALKQGAI